MFLSVIFHPITALTASLSSSFCSFTSVPLTSLGSIQLGGLAELFFFSPTISFAHFTISQKYLNKSQSLVLLLLLNFCGLCSETSELAYLIFYFQVPYLHFLCIVRLSHAVSFLEIRYFLQWGFSHISFLTLVFSATDSHL